MTSLRQRVLILIATCLAIGALAGLGAIFVQSHLLRDAIATISEAPATVQRELDRINQTESVEDLRSLSSARLHTHEATKDLVALVTRNIQVGVVVVALVIVLLCVTLLVLLRGIMAKYLPSRGRHGS